MDLDICIRKKLPPFELQLDLRCPAETMSVVIGPSGAGKTTLIRIIAGLETADAGRIQYGQEVWLDTERGICLPPQRRCLGYVFQDYTLFPHLTVEKNVAFAAKDRDKVRYLLEAFGLSSVRDRKPDAISGGERQRCAICQALAREPRVLLMDEPFSALDVFTRRDLRDKVHTVKGELSIPVVYVTHDVNEALFLADRLVPIVEGRLDRTWLQRSLARAGSPGDERARSVREPRLSLAY
jgi:molybdate transport system ATP-binding protein